MRLSVKSSLNSIPQGALGHKSYPEGCPVLRQEIGILETSTQTPLVITICYSCIRERDIIPRHHQIKCLQSSKAISGEDCYLEPLAAAPSNAGN